MPFDVRTLLGSLASEPSRDRLRRALARKCGEARSRRLSTDDLAGCTRIASALAAPTNLADRTARKLAEKALATHAEALDDLRRLRAFDQALAGRASPGVWTPEEQSLIEAFSMSHDRRARHFEQVDPTYFVDYALFSGQLRRFVADELEAWLQQHPELTYRAFHTIVLFRETHAALEDAGAMLCALMDYTAASKAKHRQRSRRRFARPSTRSARPGRAPREA